MNKDSQQHERTIGPLDFHGAAIINPDGSETPITDEMINKACDELERSSQSEATKEH